MAAILCKQQWGTSFTAQGDKELLQPKNLDETKTRPLRSFRKTR